MQAEWTKWKEQKKNWKALGKHIIISNSSGISQVIKIRDVKKIQEDIENDLIIIAQMTYLGFF